LSAVSPKLPPGIRKASVGNLIGSCGRYGSIVSAEHYPGFGLACCELRSKAHLSVNVLSGTQALDPVVLSGVIAAQLPSRFWSASLPHGRLIGHLAIFLKCIGALRVLSGWATNLARTHLRRTIGWFS